MSECHVPSPSSIPFTPFTRGKIRWWFNIMDVDKDSSISLSDFHLIAEPYVKEYHLDDVLVVGLCEKLVKWWGITQDYENDLNSQLPVVAKMKDDLTAGRKITQVEFIDAIEQLMQSKSHHLATSTISNMVSVLFDIFDYDQDNHITKTEFTVAMRCFGLDEPEVVNTVFTCMDVDKDGRLSRREYTDGWLDFILDQDRDNVLASHLRVL